IEVGIEAVIESVSELKGIVETESVVLESVIKLKGIVETEPVVLESDIVVVVAAIIAAVKLGLIMLLIEQSSPKLGHAP
ncbi:MAG: hypothetical protein KC462_05130, partial [Cyanobacteria bacterium HKST-UBA05]|nr:hypothetical protein [Cyanobacteria bacterium HKST-UBA05]